MYKFFKTLKYFLVRIQMKSGSKNFKEVLNNFVTICSMPELCKIFLKHNCIGLDVS